MYLKVGLGTFFERETLYEMYMKSDYALGLASDLVLVPFMASDASDLVRVPFTGLPGRQPDSGN